MSRRHLLVWVSATRDWLPWVEATAQRDRAAFLDSGKIQETTEIKMFTKHAGIIFPRNSIIGNIRGLDHARYQI